jgi:peptide-methionine (R)-S-oxide reductase
MLSINQVSKKTCWVIRLERSPIEPENVVENMDTSHGITRTGVRSTRGESHLSHLLPDGPPEGGGLRINSASLRFIPLDEFESEGYGDYTKRFEIRDEE